MNVVRILIAGIVTRRRVSRRVADAVGDYQTTRQALIDEKFTGEVKVRWAEGVEKSMAISNDYVIQLTR